MSRVSFLVPLYNGSRYIADSIKSLAAQSHRDVEIVVVDDASTDSSVPTAEAALGEVNVPSVLVQHPQNRGVGAAVATALGTATGDWVCFASHDDLMPPTLVEESLSAAEDAGVLVTCPPSRAMDSSGKHLNYWYTPPQLITFSPQELFVRLLSRNFISAPGVMCKRDVVSRILTYPEESTCGDWAALLEFAVDQRMLTVSPRVSYRISPSSLNRSRSHAEQIEEKVQVLLRMFARMDLERLAGLRASGSDHSVLQVCAGGLAVMVLEQPGVAGVVAKFATFLSEADLARHDQLLGERLAVLVNAASARAAEVPATKIRRRERLKYWPSRIPAIPDRVRVKLSTLGEVDRTAVGLRLLDRF